MSHRKPPRPNWEKGPGFCRWCGEPVTKPDGSASKRRWHPGCLEAYGIAAWPESARVAVWAKDRGICQGCKTDLAARANETFPSRSIESLRTRLPSWAPAWQADHIRPLIEGAGLDLAFFAVENLQVLCDRCHKRKTAKESAERANARQEVKKTARDHAQTTLL